MVLPAVNPPSRRESPSMSEDITPAELGRAMDRFASALDKFAARLDAISDRLDKLPMTIDDRYMRKDVMTERNKRVDGALTDLASAVKSTTENSERQFEKLGNNMRWLVGVVFIPIFLAIVALLSQHGGFG